MIDENQAKPSPEEQNLQLRGRISELEEEVARVRRALEIAETALKAHKDPMATLRHSMDEAPIGFALYTDEMRYRIVNKSLAEINGIAAEDHIGIFRALQKINVKYFRQLRPRGQLVS